MYGTAAGAASDDKYGSGSGYGYAYNGISSGGGHGGSSSSGYGQGYGVGSKEGGPGPTSPVQHQQHQYQGQHNHSSSGGLGYEGKAVAPGQQYVGGHVNSPFHQGGHGYNDHSHSKGYSPHHDLDESIGEIYVPPHHSPQPTGTAAGSSSSMGSGQAMGAISEEDVSDLFSFARHGRVEEIERMLNRGVPVDVRDEWGNTLLTTACQNGNKRVAKAVLRRGANINARNAKGNTPLHYCFHFGYGDTLGQYIISKGADESARNNQGKPPWDGI